MTNALGNRIKALRQKHNLSQTLLAEQLQVSHAYIGFLEKGTRKGSNELLQKIATYFNIDYAELVDLRDHNINENDFQLSIEEPIQSQYPSYIDEFATLLCKIEESTCRKLLDDFKEQLHKKLYQLLTPYEMKSVKQMIMEVKRMWLSLLNQQEINATLFKTYQGYINQGEKEIFFQLEINESALSVTLLYSEQNQITTFENWLGDFSVRFINELNLPHLAQSQKVSSFVWFSPSLSVLNKFRYLQEQSIKLEKVTCSEHQLNWYIQQYLLENSKEASTM